MREEPIELFIQNAYSLRSASLLLLPPLLLLLLPLLLLLLVGGGGCGVVGSNLSVSSVQLHQRPHPPAISHDHSLPLPAFCASAPSIPARRAAKPAIWLRRFGKVHAAAVATRHWLGRL